MFNEIKNLIASGDIDEESLTSAAAHLLRNQFVFRSHAGDQSHYQVIDRYFLQFENAFAFFGSDLVRSVDNGYIGFIPRKTLSTLKLVETALLLTLRLIYDQEKLTGISHTKDGSIIVSGERVINEYKRNTGRDDLDKSQSFREAIQPLRKKSIIRLGDRHTVTDVEDIIILPSIESIIDKHYAGNLIKSLENHQVDESENSEKDLLNEAY
jgi:hypothetical protein